MPQGIYKAFKRRKEAGSTLMLTHNLQTWLAIFAFCSIIVIELGKPVWGWWSMLELSAFQWFLYILGSIIVLFFVAMGIYSLLNLLKLLWRAKFGELVEYDESWPPYLLAAITPIEREANIKKYRNILGVLIKQNNKLIRQNNKLVNEYSDIIKRLEAKNNVNGKVTDKTSATTKIE
ncbi:MAG: hypothetical protein ISS58_04980 [Dehalococcoidales bacterium]|nr:hypothetical protein [Dehalococcoidales bacterium]